MPEPPQPRAAPVIPVKESTFSPGPGEVQGPPRASVGGRALCPPPLQPWNKGGPRVWASVWKPLPPMARGRL
ncbi:uncharacterized protein STAUR_4511 [Stigmatella aurantiaca DW4/3-1]|uniref:Uncharacterized protein n=1 Tax=Stigmatella aurantiaca (strain DW4/3-1) TaxID=378806 RepID=E3FX52_STIAD|nr:uncharacterized protein STAUR_4511 [Stigmatella aurantiaca DW4/3-1]